MYKNFTMGLGATILKSQTVVARLKKVAKQMHTNTTQEIRKIFLTCEPTMQILYSVQFRVS